MAVVVSVAFFCFFFCGYFFREGSACIVFWGKDKGGGEMEGFVNSFNLEPWSDLFFGRESFGRQKNLQSGICVFSLHNWEGAACFFWKTTQKVW